ncbi:unnamed protein product [Bursaphelenchus xylophilus]|uniref:(pine wood nematode) hypothetical protein n=1 Tax=Bursaphelenchus xylophilus TaxID=6326 RepID=A0A1I7STR3_BURXY|nr:unnamed protein product [Bursaphelenchus xylophilus]CAG9108071.1 unnamed protein product [Bursaphelenchus xylophilus]
MVVMQSQQPTVTVQPNHPIFAFVIKYGLSCTAATFAETVTYPLDITKTRLQVSTRTTGRRRSMIRMSYNIAKKEGMSSLWLGVWPAICRHYVYTGVRTGLYELIRNNWYDPKKEKRFPVWKALISGLVSGAVGQFVSSPADLVKVQMQTEGLRKRQGLPPRYKGAFDAFLHLYRTNGIRGLWLGWVPNCQRAALLNMADLATYDRTKRFILDNTSLEDNWMTHVCASASSGLAAAIVSTPADVVKTRIMDQIRQEFDGGSAFKRRYKGSLHCLRIIVRTEGFWALYRGFLPTYVRMAPWSLTFWVSYEKIRQITGAPSF